MLFEIQCPFSILAFPVNWALELHSQHFQAHTSWASRCQCLLPGPRHQQVLHFNASYFHISVLLLVHRDLTLSFLIFSFYTLSTLDIRAMWKCILSWPKVEISYLQYYFQYILITVCSIIYLHEHVMVNWRGSCILVERERHAHLSPRYSCDQQKSRQISPVHLSVAP